MKTLALAALLAAHPAQAAPMKVSSAICELSSSFTSLKKLGENRYAYEKAESPSTKGQKLTSFSLIQNGDAEFVPYGVSRSFFQGAYELRVQTGVLLDLEGEPQFLRLQLLRRLKSGKVATLHESYTTGDPAPVDGATGESKPVSRTLSLDARFDGERSLLAHYGKKPGNAEFLAELVKKGWAAQTLAEAATVRCSVTLGDEAPVSLVK